MSEPGPAARRYPSPTAQRGNPQNERADPQPAAIGTFLHAADRVWDRSTTHQYYPHEVHPGSADRLGSPPRSLRSYPNCTVPTGPMPSWAVSHPQPEPQPQQPVSFQVVLEASEATMAVERNHHEEYAQSVSRQLEEAEAKLEQQALELDDARECRRISEQQVRQLQEDLTLTITDSEAAAAEEREECRSSERQIHQLKGDLAQQRDRCELLLEKLSLREEQLWAEQRAKAQLEEQLQEAQELQLVAFTGGGQQQLELCRQQHSAEVEGLVGIVETQEQMLEDNNAASAEMRTQLEESERKLLQATAAATRAENENKELQAEFEQSSEVLAEVVEVARVSDDNFTQERSKSAALSEQVSYLEYELLSLKNQLRAQDTVEQSLEDSTKAAANMLKAACASVGETDGGWVSCMLCARQLTQFAVPADGQFVCDVCDQVFTSLNTPSLMSCRECDFDVCCGCSNSKSSMATESVPSSKKEIKKFARQETPRWMNQALSHVKNSKQV